VSASDAWAVGDADSKRPASGTTWALHWNGTAWTRLTVPQPYYSCLTGVSAVSAADVWAVGFDNRGTLILHWNGSRWSHVASPHPGPTSQLDGISMVSARDGWAAGMSIPNGRADKTVMLHWNGTSWAQVPSPSPKNYSGLQAVSAVSARDVLAAGWTSPFLHTRNYTLLLRWTGTHWQRA
jgi:hypothetical protein